MKQQSDFILGNDTKMTDDEVQAFIASSEMVKLRYGTILMEVMPTALTEAQGAIVSLTRHGRLKLRAIIIKELDQFERTFGKAAAEGVRNFTKEESDDAYKNLCLLHALDSSKTK